MVMQGDTFKEKANFSVTQTTKAKQLDFCVYRSGAVNSKFHLIQSFFEIFARFLSFHV